MIMYKKTFEFLVLHEVWILPHTQYDTKWECLSHSLNWEEKYGGSVSEDRYRLLWDSTIFTLISAHKLEHDACRLRKRQQFYQCRAIIGNAWR